MTHEDTYIHGPFDFASVHGRKTRDRISQSDWDILRNHKRMFQNELPKFDIPTYSIHVDRGCHVAYCDQDLAAQLPSAYDNTEHFMDSDWSQLQKVFASLPIISQKKLKCYTPQESNV